MFRRARDRFRRCRTDRGGDRVREPLLHAIPLLSDGAATPWVFREIIAFYRIRSIKRKSAPEWERYVVVLFGAGTMSRTRDLLITNHSRKRLVVRYTA